MRLFGQEFDPGTLARIRGAIAEDASLSRSELSRRVCAWLDWRGLNGRPCEVSSRKALLALDQQGLIALPPPRPAPIKAPPRAREPAREESWTAPVFQGSLAELGAVELVAVERRDPLSGVWRQMLEAHHPLGAGPLCGAQQRYLIRAEHVGWVGALAFSAAAWHLKPRDEWIQWNALGRRANLHRVVANSRFLILPSVAVPNLGSHVLGLAAARVVRDWPERYGYAPVLLESFVDESRFAGTVYKAANWVRVGETQGRGRRDRDNRAAAGVKAIYLLPLRKDWDEILWELPERRLRLPAEAADAEGRPGWNWAKHEFGRADLPDGRLRKRLVDVADAFFKHPIDPIPVAFQGDAVQTQAAYRFFHNPQVTLETLLHSHYEATAGRIKAHPRVLVAQDTTSLNYDRHPATSGLGPINTRADGAQGLKLHDSLALTPEGIPLGLVDIQVWARDPHAEDEETKDPRRPIEAKESFRWLHSFRRTAAIQRLCPHTHLISIADREADIYELFQEALQDPAGPDLLIRASRTTQRQVIDDETLRPLWEFIPAQPVAGGITLAIPGRGGRPPRVAELEVRFAPVQLRPPQRIKGEALALWAIHAVEPNPPKGAEPVEWLLLTTVPTHSFDEAVERLGWYAARWNIEVFHRTLKSGCRIEDRRLADADSLEACLALDLVVAWRVMYLAKLGRETPDIPCTVFFEDAEWKALVCHHDRTRTPPETPPTIGEAMRMVAKIGGFLGRKGDGHPGATVLWRGLDKLAYITEMFLVFYPAIPSGP
jgi:hypothetical protein